MDETQSEEIAIRKDIANDASLVLSLILGLAEFVKWHRPATAARQRFVSHSFGLQPAPRASRA